MLTKLITLTQAKKIVQYVNNLIRTKIDAFKQEFNSEVAKRPTLDKFIAGENITLTPDNDKATLLISADTSSTTDEDILDTINDDFAIKVDKFNKHYLTIEKKRGEETNPGEAFTDSTIVYYIGVADDFLKTTIFKNRIGKGLSIVNDSGKNPDYHYKVVNNLFSDNELSFDEKSILDRRLRDTTVINELLKKEYIKLEPYTISVLPKNENFPKPDTFSINLDKRYKFINAYLNITNTKPQITDRCIKYFYYTYYMSNNEPYLQLQYDLGDNITNAEVIVVYSI